jgi:hypothetical protein
MTACLTCVPRVSVPAVNQHNNSLFAATEIDDLVIKEYLITAGEENYTLR